MKKSNPIITCIRLTFALTCAGALLVGCWVSLTEHQIPGAYFVTALTALVSLLITHAPDILTHKDTLMMPMAVQVAFSLFTFCAMFLGEIMNFYERFAWWDTMLHFASGIMFSLVGLMLFTSLNRRKEVRNQLNPIGVVLFAVCFSIACGTIWEMFEFAGDSLLGMNMQRWQSNVSPEEWSTLQNVSNFSNPGLINTMKDIMADAFGSIVSVALLLPLVKQGNRYENTKISTEELLDEWQGAYAAMIPARQHGEAGATGFQEEPVWSVET